MRFHLKTSFKRGKKGNNSADDISLKNIYGEGMASVKNDVRLPKTLIEYFEEKGLECIDKRNGSAGK